MDWDNRCTEPHLRQLLGLLETLRGTPQCLGPWTMGFCREPSRPCEPRETENAGRIWMLFEVQAPFGRSEIAWQFVVRSHPWWATGLTAIMWVADVCSRRKVVVRSGLGWRRSKTGIFFVQGSAWWRKPQLADSRTTPPVKQDKKSRCPLPRSQSLLHSSYRDVYNKVSGVIDIAVTTGFRIAIYGVIYGRFLLSPDVLSRPGTHHSTLYPDVICQHDQRRVHKNPLLFLNTIP